jgi:hypothetical protein
LRRLVDLQFSGEGQAQLSFGGVTFGRPSDRLYQDGEEPLPGSEIFGFLPPICMEDGLSYGICLVALAGAGAAVGYGVYELSSDNNDETNQD